MRLWSLHPQYLDRKGLGGVWLEGFVGLKALSKERLGYSNHPQLERFKTHINPVGALAEYLEHIASEAISKRGYNYNLGLLDPYLQHYELGYDKTIPVTQGQVHYEIEWLLDKLQNRGATLEAEMLLKDYHMIGYQVKLHPMFHMVSGNVESWERPEIHITEKTVINKKSIPELTRLILS